MSHRDLKNLVKNCESHSLVRDLLVIPPSGKTVEIKSGNRVVKIIVTTNARDSQVTSSVSADLPASRTRRW